MFEKHDSWIISLRQPLEIRRLQSSLSLTIHLGPLVAVHGRLTRVHLDCFYYDYKHQVYHHDHLRRSVAPLTFLNPLIKCKIEGTILQATAIEVL